MKVTFEVMTNGRKSNYSYDYPGIKRSASIVHAINEFRNNVPESVIITSMRLQKS